MPPPSQISPSLHDKREALLQWLCALDSVAVAFSGGVDSAVVAMAAHLALGDRTVAVTGTSASLASGELEAARALAKRIGIRHLEIETLEFANENYSRNAPDRCFHCKTELYSQIAARRESLDVAVIVSGANADDLGDYRPGLLAAQQHHVRHPLAECGFSKSDVRALAQFWELPVHDKPASPCLSSRVAYGEDVTPERLAMIDQAEQFLRSRGLREVRVRYHRGELARVEVPVDSIALLASDTWRQEITRHLESLGFRFVTLDLKGFRSGSLNVFEGPLYDLVWRK